VYGRKLFNSSFAMITDTSGPVGGALTKVDYLEFYIFYRAMHFSAKRGIAIVGLIMSVCLLRSRTVIK